MPRIDLQKFERRAKELEDSVGVTDEGDYVEELSKEFKITNKDVLYFLPSDSYLNYLVESKVIPNIYTSDFLDTHFKAEWLNKVEE